MKSILRHLSVLSIVLAAFLATGCYEEEVPFLMVDHEVVLVGPSSDKGTVVVESNVTWVASSEVDWITIDNGFGNHKGTFEFFVEANTTPNERSGKIKLESEDGTGATTILVRQQSEGSVLTLSTEEIPFTKDSGEYLMSVACNGDWQVVSSADWCKVEPASGSRNGSFKITVDENATGADRAAVISVLTEADGVTQVRKINVYQSASNVAIIISPEEKSLTAEAASFELDVITLGSWEASADSEWITLSANKGTGDSQLTISATKNDTGKERVAIVTFATGAENENRIVRQLVVRQAAVDFYLAVPVTDYPLSLDAQTIEIPYSLEGSNVTVSASSNVKWMTVASVADGVATVSVEENGTAVAREGVITFITAGQSGDPIVRQVRVAQAPTVNLLDVLAEEYAVEWVGATIRIPIYSNTPVSVRSSESWCQVLVEGQDIVISVPENRTSYAREAIVTVMTASETGEMLSRTTTIRQAAANSELVISPESKLIYAPAQSFVASIVTGNTWTAQSDSEWLTLDAKSGEGDYMLTVSAAKNDTGKERVATITVSTGNENENREVCHLVVTQAAVDLYLVVPVTDYPLSLGAQTIEIPYSLKGSNVTVSASSNVKWMTVASVADGVATVSVEENGTAVAREGVITFITAGQSGDPIVRQVRVAQAPTVNLLDVLAEEYAVEWVGATIRIPIYSNTPVSVRSSESWCQVLVEGQDIVISVPENRTAYAREAIVTVMTASETGEILSRTTTIRQAAAYSELVASPETKSIYANAQTFVASIVTNNTWTAQSDSEWLTLDAKSGEGDYMLTVSAAANETGQLRTAVITIQTGGENSKRETATITVNQRPEQFYFEVPTRSYLVGKYGDEITIPYVTSGNEQSVKASASVDWISVKSVADGGVKVAVAENKTAETRTGVVTITCTPVFGDPISINVTFTQSPTVNILDAFVDEIKVMARGDEVALPYYANTSVSLSSSETWCHVSVDVDEDSYEATGCCSYSDPQKIIKVEVDPNRTAEARIAYVTISTVSDSGEKLTKVITVRQAALNAALSVSPKTIVLPAHDAESHITVLTTGTWTVSYDCTWFELDSLAGFADGGIDLTAGDNDTGAERESEIIIATGPENEVRSEQIVKVRQLMRDTYLEIPESAYALTKVEQKLTVGYFAAGDFKDMQVNCSEDWISYDSSNSDETNFVFNVNENTTAKSRTATVTVTLDLVKGEPITKSFIVSQAPTINILDVYVDKINASAYGQVDTLAYYGNTPVAAISSAAWCKVAIDQNGDPQTVTITCDANRTAESRTAYVTLTTITDKGEKLTKIITVEQESMNATLMVSPEKVVLPAEDAVFYLAVATTGDWEVKSDLEWISILPAVSKGTGDATVKVNLRNNDTGLTREGTITVVSGIENETRVEKTVHVIQLPENTYIEIPLKAYTVSKEKQSLEVLFWEAGDIINSDVSSSASWLKFKSYLDGKIDFEVEENTTGEVRTATATLSATVAGAEPITKTITVTQAATVNILEAMIDFVALSPAKDTALLPAITNVSELHTTVSDSWLTADVSIDADSQIAEVEIIAEPNTTGVERNATVTLTTATGKGQTLTKTITVVQVPSEQYFAILNPSVIQLPKHETDYVLYAYASPANNLDQAITITFGADWVSWTQIDYMYDNIKAFACKTKENNTGVVRSMDVKINWEDETGYIHSGDVTLVQAAESESEFVCLVDYLEAKPEGEDITLTFDTVDPLTATPSAGWISATVNSRVAPQTLVIKAAENNTGKSRTGYVTVSNGSKSYVITVFQPAKDVYFDLVSADVIYLSEKAHDVEPDVLDILAYANFNPSDVRFTPSSSWLTLNKKSYVGNVVTGTFLVQENTDTEARTATVKIFYQDQAGDTHTETVTVVQKGAEPNVLETLVDYLVIDGENPVEQTLSFISNKDVTVASSAAWCTATAVGTNVTIAADGANTTGAGRTAYVTVTNEELKVLVTVYQPARSQNFEVISPDAYYISAAAQDVKLYAYATDPTRIESVSDAAWFSHTDEEIIRAAYHVTFSAQENTSTEARTSIVKFTYIDESGEAKTADVKVVQAGAEPNKLEALVDYIAMDAVDAEAQTLAFVSNKPVTVASSAAWCTATVENDTYVKIEAADNTTGVDRTAYVTVTNEELNVVVTVFQPANGNFFSILSSDVIYLTKEAQDVNIMAYANVNADKIVPESSSSWFAFNEQTVAENIYWGMFKAAENTDSETRTAIVKFNYVDEKGQSHSAEVKIVQEPTIIEPNVLESLVDNLVFEAVGAEPQTLSFISNKTVTAESSAAWCTAAVDADGRVTISAADNTTGRARTAYVTVKNEELHVLVTVTQLAGESSFAILSGENMLIGKEAQSVLINAFASVNCEKVNMESNASWLKLNDILAGSNVASYAFDAEANTGAEARTANVTVTFFDAIGATTQKTVTVSQAAANGGALAAVSKSFVMKAEGETIDLVLASDREITATAGISTVLTNWLSADANKVAGFSNLVFTAEANTTGEPRVGYISLTDGVENVTVTVYQLAKTAEPVEFTLISPEVMHLDAEGGDIVYTAIGNYNKAIQTLLANDCAWIEPIGVSRPVGDVVNGIATGSVKVLANTGAARKGSVVMTVIDKATRKVLFSKVLTIAQAAAGETVLDALVEDVTLAAKGETMTLSFTTSDGIGSAVSSSAWLGVTVNSDESTIDLSAEANATGAPRTAYVTVKKDGISRIVKVYQPATTTNYAILTPDMAVTSVGNEFTLAAYGEGFITAQASADWITTPNFSPYGNLIEIKVKVAPNNTHAVREGEVKVSWKDAAGNAHTESMKIVQSPTAAVLDIYEDEISLDEAGETVVLDVYATDVPMSVGAKSSDKSWLTASFNNSESKITVKAPKNATGVNRSATVTVTARFADGTIATKDITVTQKAAEIE